MNDFPNIRRCPRCGSLPVQYYERWEGFAMSFLTRQDGSAEAEGVLCDGYPEGVDAICGGCKFRWRLRGVAQISEVQNPDARCGPGPKEAP